MGYTIDHYFGDSDYSFQEALVDGTLGALGGGIVGPAYTASGRAVTVLARYADDAVRVGYGGAVTAVGYVGRPFARPIGVKILATGPVESFYEKIMSSGSRSERNASNVCPGGTPPGYKQPSKHYRKYDGIVRKSKVTCPPGYTLVLVKGKLLCRPDGSRLPGRAVRYQH